MRVAVCTVIIALLISLPVLAQNKSPKEIAREISKAVVTIEALDDRGSVIGQGSGFVATENGAVITNLHVVQGAAMARIKLPSGDVYKTSDVIAEDDAKDIVILKIKGFKLPRVILGDSDKTEVGENVVVISSPEGLSNTVSTGVISGMRRFDTHRVFQITSPISQGSSGGAMFNSNGEVIGIVTYIYKGGQNINFAVPINYARGMVSDEVTSQISRLRAPQKTKGSKPAQTSLADSIAEDGQAEDELNSVSRGKLGRTQQEPMFVRPDEALAFFYRLVEGIGRNGIADVGELTRTAAVLKAKESDDSVTYSIKYLSFFGGLGMDFSKPDRLLSAVELLVNWSIADVKGTFGEKFKRRTLDGQKVLDYGFTGDATSRLQLIAILDGNGNVRSVRFSKVKEKGR